MLRKCWFGYRCYPAGFTEMGFRRGREREKERTAVWGKGRVNLRYQRWDTANMAAEKWIGE